MMDFFKFDIDPVTVAVVVFMIILIFAIAGATIQIDLVNRSGQRLDTNNTPNANNNKNKTSDHKPMTPPVSIDAPDEAYLSETTRRHLLMEQDRYYTDSCPMI